MKHLNPRQGITTRLKSTLQQVISAGGVKHLNPRQGITTVFDGWVPSDSDVTCETPKSPPGDYNKNAANCMPPARHTVRLKHLNPRQGITTSDV